MDTSDRPPEEGEHRTTAQYQEVQEEGKGRSRSGINWRRQWWTQPHRLNTALYCLFYLLSMFYPFNYRNVKRQGLTPSPALTLSPTDLSTLPTREESSVSTRQLRFSGM